MRKAGQGEDSLQRRGLTTLLQPYAATAEDCVRIRRRCTCINEDAPRTTVAPNAARFLSSR